MPLECRGKMRDRKATPLPICFAVYSIPSSSSSRGSGSDSLSDDASSSCVGRMRSGVYCARNVAVEMFCDRFDAECDLVASGKGVYGGGGPRLDEEEFRGRTMGGVHGVKRKGWDSVAAVADVARLRMGVRLLEEEVRLRK